MEGGKGGEAEKRGWEGEERGGRRSMRE